jgi:[acyl-carrier-protein] S-malonyltransferase
MKTAVIFPGQGSQFTGMADAWTSDAAGGRVLEEASDVLGYDIVEACRDEERLADTAVVQPAIFACDLAAFSALEARGVTFFMAAGHSLGEFAALVAAGTLEFRPCLEVVALRGSATRDAAAHRPGSMTAIVGCSPDEAADICRVAGRGDVLAVANVNSPVQTVVSGSMDAVSRAEELARSRGARAIRLNVAGAFHSPLMHPAVAPVRRGLAGLAFHEPRFPLVPNASGKPTNRGAALRDLLSRQLVSPVQWERSLRAMSEAGIGCFVEAGPGDVLTRLVRRCVPDAMTFSVGSPSDADAFVASLREAT